MQSMIPREAVIMTLARREAKEAIKAGIRSAGGRPSDFSAAEIAVAAQGYLAVHQEDVCAFVAERYATLIAKFSTPAQRRRR